MAPTSGHEIIVVIVVGRVVAVPDVYPSHVDVNFMLMDRGGMGLVCNRALGLRVRLLFGIIIVIAIEI